MNELQFYVLLQAIYDKHIFVGPTYPVVPQAICFNKQQAASRKGLLILDLGKYI